MLGLPLLIHKLEVIVITRNVVNNKKLNIKPIKYFFIIQVCKVSLYERVNGLIHGPKATDCLNRNEYT